MNNFFCLSLEHILNVCFSFFSFLACSTTLLPKNTNTATSPVCLCRQINLKTQTCPPHCLLNSPTTATASPTRGVAAMNAARVSQQAAAAASAALSARRAGYPLAVAAALANSHQRNLVLAGQSGGNNGLSAGGIPCSVAVSVGGHGGHVTLTSSMNAALAQAAAQQQQQQQAAVAGSPTLHGLSP